ncbi:MAG: hypothetical protein K2H09_07025 [Treponemataceae bacterium]|nr:hypothetical protein [Treponemataceae bacterium]
MNSLPAQQIFVIISAAICAVILATTPLRKRFILRRAGERIFAAKRKRLVLPVLVMACCALLLVLSALRDLGTAANAILCLVAILGTAMSSEDAATHSICGVYRNGLVGGGHFLPISEIYDIPELSYTPEEREKESGTVLHVVTDKRGSVSFVYSSAKERAEALEALLTVAPALRR